MECFIPKPILLSEYDGDYAKYQDAIYCAFQECFEQQHFTFNGLPIGHKKYPEYNGKSATFWHIISEGSDEQNRLPDLRRCEKIKWPFYILDHCAMNCPKLLTWENTRHGQARVLLFCPDKNYLVVLAKRKDYFVFWTAYPITEAHRKRKLLKEYKEYIAKAAQQ